MAFLKIAAQDRLVKNFEKSQIMKVHRLLNWEKISIILKPLNKKGMDLGGQRPYDSLKMFKSLLLGQWHNLSDKGLEESLRVRLDFMLFTDLDESVPDASTLCRFRNAMNNKNLWEKMLNEVNRQLSKNGFHIEHCEGAVVDATLIESSRRPRKIIETDIAKDREENVIEERLTKIGYSKDTEATWLKKANRFHYGFKGFVTTTKQGFIRKVHMTPANVSEMNQLSKCLEGIKCQKVYTDKGYCSEKNRKLLKEKKLKDGIMHKAVRGKLLSEEEKIKNRNISKIRFVVEQTFGTLKRRFHFWRSSYLGCERTLGQCLAKSICLNLLKAVRRVSF